jgi:glutamate synthase (NADPH/NADH) large chain
MPEIIQVLFKSNDPNLLDKNLERKIYETRKRIENKAFDASLNNFYICSISSKSIIYKGLYLAEAISDFYLDLKRSKICIKICNFSSKIFNKHCT